MSVKVIKETCMEFSTEYVYVNWDNDIEFQEAGSTNDDKVTLKVKISMEQMKKLYEKIGVNLKARAKEQIEQANKLLEEESDV